MPVATARSHYLTDMKQKYPQIKNTRLDTCGVCHVSKSGGGERNSFGKAYDENKNFSAIENLDSDNDGFSNIKEINALTFPGNASDHPKAEESTPAESTPIKTQSSPGFGYIVAVIGLMAVVSLMKLKKSKKL